MSSLTSSSSVNGRYTCLTTDAIPDTSNNLLVAKTTRDSKTFDLKPPTLLSKNSNIYFNDASASFGSIRYVVSQSRRTVKHSIVSVRLLIDKTFDIYKHFSCNSNSTDVSFELAVILQ